MKESNIFKKNIIGIIAIGIIKFILVAVICPAVRSAILNTVTDWLYTGVICFAAAVIISESGCVFPHLEKGKKLLSRSSVVRMIIAFILSAVLTSSIVIRIIAFTIMDRMAYAVALGVLYALKWIVIYITMTVKNSNSPRIGGLLTVCASALIFSVVSQLISVVLMEFLMQNMNGSLLDYLSVLSGPNCIMILISCATDILIMCSMAVAAHFFRRKNSV